MRALRKREAQPACAFVQTHACPLRRPISSHLGRWAYLKYTQITLAIGGNGAGTKFGVGAASRDPCYGRRNARSSERRSSTSGAPRVTV
jgi:hypothetical protein